MGWQTALLFGLKAFSAASEISASKKAANATIEEGNIAAANKAKQTLIGADKQRVSFLNSGLTLEGTPMNVIESTFNTGITDINQITKNYNTKASNQLSAGRSQAITSLASGFGSASLPDMGLSNFSSGFSSGYDNAVTLQTGATPGIPNSPAGLWLPSNQPLPWKA